MRTGSLHLQHSCFQEGEKLWNEAKPDIDALKTIVSHHFHSPCCDEVLMKGAYARVFLFTLENDQKIVARVVLPVRERVKTEAEVATMAYIRGTTLYFKEVMLILKYSRIHHRSNFNSGAKGLPLLQHAS